MHIARPALLFILVTPLVTADKQPNPFNIPAEGYNFTAGHASTITWKPTTEGDVTLRLRSGPTNDLDQGIVIAGTTFINYLHLMYLPLGAADFNS